MGLGDANILDDGDGKVPVASVSCSICLELVIDNGDRSWAKLQCGHQFHLDCIGSAFNVKGAMQCPNCRKVEKGQWLYANGSRLLPELSTDDWIHDDDLYGLGYSEMSFGVHWCPYSGLTRLPSSFDEGELSSTTYRDLLGRQADVVDRTTVPSTTHPCPYVAYFGPIHPSSSASNASVSDVPSFNGHWSSASVPNQSIQTMTQRTTRNSSDVPRPGMHPIVVGHRAPSSSSLLPYPGIGARPRNHANVQAQFQQPSSNTAVRTPGGRRFNSIHRGGMSQVAPPAPQSLDHHPRFFFFSSENLHHDHANSWDRQQQHQPPPFTLSQLDRDSIWGPFRPVSDSGMRLSSNIRQRHGSERMPSQNWPS